VLKFTTMNENMPAPTPEPRPAPRNARLYVAMIPYGDDYRPGIYLYLNKAGAAFMRRDMAAKGAPVQTWRVTQPAPGGHYQIVRDPDNEVSTLSLASLLELGVPPFVLCSIVRKFMAASLARDRERWLAQPGHDTASWFGSPEHTAALMSVHEIVRPLFRTLIPLESEFHHETRS
jgi:hypothetical protein